MKQSPIPPELEGGFRACAALHDDEHWAVYIALMEHGDMSMHGLAQKFAATYHELALILEDLINGGLVEGFTIWDEDIGGDYKRIYYRATVDGLRFYGRLMESISPLKDDRHFKRINSNLQKIYEKLYGEPL